MGPLRQFPDVLRGFVCRFSKQFVGGSVLWPKDVVLFRSYSNYGTTLVVLRGSRAEPTSAWEPCGMGGWGESAYWSHLHTRHIP